MNLKPFMIAAAAIGMSDIESGWSQKTEYKKPSRDNVAAVKAAEEKRRRKAEKLKAEVAAREARKC